MAGLIVLCSVARLCSVVGVGNTPTSVLLLMFLELQEVVDTLLVS